MSWWNFPLRKKLNNVIEKFGAIIKILCFKLDFEEPNNFINFIIQSLLVTRTTEKC